MDSDSVADPRARERHRARLGCEAGQPGEPAPWQTGVPMRRDRRIPVWLERLALVAGAPIVFLLIAEATIALTGIDTDVARNENAQIAVPVWLLADEDWIADRRARMRRSGGEPIAAAEVAWLYHFEEARWIGYKLKPNIDVEAVNPFNEAEVAKNVTFRIVSNSDGFRDRELEPKRPGKVRIVTLGDSSTFGWGAQQEHTFQALLEDRLEAWQPGRFEVLNLGMPGYNTHNGIGVLEHYARGLDPDVVIVSFGANDPRKVPRPTAEVLALDDTALGALRYRLLDLGTYRLLRKVVLSLSDPLSRPTSDEAQGRAKVPAVDLDSYRANLQHIDETVRGDGGGTIFLSVCTSDRQYVATTRDVAAAAGAPFLDARELFGTVIDQLEAGELMPELVARYRRLYGIEAMTRQRSLYLTSDGCHPHRIGNSLIAQQLEGLVRAALGRPRAPTSSGE